MNKNIKPLTKAIGIVSWFPNAEPARGQRMGRMKRLLKQIGEFLPGLPVIIIAQNWNGAKFDAPKNKLIVYNYEKLGILKARQELRSKFLALNFDYLIMFDDDAVLDCGTEALEEYFALMDQNPHGFAFSKRENLIEGCRNPYVDSQLNFCAISRWIYEKEPMPETDPAKNVAYEDRIFSMLLHTKYPENEFDIPLNVQCIHFRNSAFPAPSTWAKEKRVDLSALQKHTLKLEEYIYENKSLPFDIQKFLNED